MEIKGLHLIQEYSLGKLYEANGFLIPVITGSNIEMGEQYGALMVKEMQKTYDTLVQPLINTDVLNDLSIKLWVNRAYYGGSLRTRQFYDGVVLGSGWTLSKVVILDQIMEFGIYTAQLKSFAGCTSIASFGKHSKDGNMYIGRNLDWSPEFNQFPTVFTVRKPTDGSFKIGTTGWPGMYCTFTAVNDHGVYLDIHDGTSMGGSIVTLERPSILNTVIDLLSETNSLPALSSRFNGLQTSISIIFTLADKANAISTECSSLAGNRIRNAKKDSLVVANTFINDDWGLRKRETESNSLKRFSNMKERLQEQKGHVDASIIKDLMDLKLFNKDNSFKENGGSTKPMLQDTDITNYQTVFDIDGQKVWLKIPVPGYYADWTELDLKELFA
ncbi:C45 family autoproteolytic acyltransferase/hydolase [Flammeovirga agarivorans]|uniref:Peptidase C45 hydrolase domain-containing protein n=1 Tax=Flammeovirga agarivorans TaxID=2726742 RepID=A0A7X8SPH3_9BACT|nr:C45 family peptidase [Flammeovirga agarivorans]NLR93986.1 hypothetical protein [Flammeovirga agarivorans]